MDSVYHPKHYNENGRKECWDEMIDIFGAEAVVVFDCLNAYKYLYRAGKKEGNTKSQDIEKMKNYIEHANKLTNTYLVDSDVIETLDKIEKLKKGNDRKMVKQNPCRYCINSRIFQGRNAPGHPNCPCENWELHQEYLESKRKYEPGKSIVWL